MNELYWVLLLVLTLNFGSPVDPSFQPDDLYYDGIMPIMETYGEEEEYILLMLELGCPECLRIR